LECHSKQQVKTPSGNKREPLDAVLPRAHQGYLPKEFIMDLAPFVLQIVFWSSLALVVYAYAAYPVVIWLCSRCFARRASPLVEDEKELPFVSLLIAAYNEEAEIEKRIQTALMTDYPTDRFEIVIASDGSSDTTPQIVRRFAAHRVRLLDYRQRRGKASVLNAAFPEVKGEIVLLSDANTMTDPQALRKIIRWFRDPQVGVVCGRLILTDPATGRNADSLYWKYETFLKKCEGRLGALLGANGGIYAIRRGLFAPIPSETIVDDFVIPLQARLRTGCQLIYEPEAIAYEETPANIGSEFHRRSRIGAGGFQSIVMLRGLLHPGQGWTAFSFLSHKVLRWLCPFFLLAMLASHFCLLGDPWFCLALWPHLGFYGLSVGIGYLPVRSRLLKPLRLTTMFTSMNAALLVGFWRWLWGTQKGAWRRTARLAEAEGVV
jgi:cellulose synthase/poly-beta-1,6-N-acetylglucosamine synthase-like glycosyltransferase